MDDLSKRRFERQAHKINARLVALEEHLRGINHQAAELHRLLSDQLDTIERVTGPTDETRRIRREIDQMMMLFEEDAAVMPALDALGMIFDEASISLAALAGALPPPPDGASST